VPGSIGPRATTLGLKMGRYRVAQKLEARGFSETYAYFYQTVGRHMPEDSTVCNHCWQNIKFDNILLILFGILIKFYVIWVWIKLAPMYYRYLQRVLDFSMLLFPENVKHYYQQSHNIYLTNERVATFCFSSQSSPSVQSSTAIMEQLCHFTAVV
jgi:hypothetical protein